MTTQKELNSQLLNAAYNNEVGNVLSSLQQGADVEAKDVLGNTALIWASMSGHIDVVMTLLEAGADPDSRNKKGRTALFFAKECSHTEVGALIESFVENQRLLKSVSPETDEQSVSGLHF